MLDLKLIEELSTLLSGNVSTSRKELEEHSSNIWYVSGYLPDVIAYAQSEEDVMAVTNFCIKHKIPLIPYGSGTSVEGHTAAIHGGVCLDLSRMNKILEVNVVDGYVIVEPGIKYNLLNEELNKLGVYFPVEAGLGASIGGMVSTNASGAGALDSGSMARNVMGLELVVYENDSAKKIKTGSKSTKTSAGYNLTNLIIGSEGTLGIVTQICLKIKKKLTHTKTLCCQFNSTKEAIDFVIAMKGSVQLRRAELLDELQTKACVKYSEISNLYPDKITVLVELSGNESTTTAELKIVKDYLNSREVEMVKVFEDQESAKNIWLMRKNACPAAIKLIDETKKAMVTDISVPLSRLNECIESCNKIMQAMGIKAPLVAHVGDGNFHITLIIDPNSQADLQLVKDFNERIIVEALRCDGTCTGEHGIGLGKKHSLELEHGDSLPFMQRIKKSFDPKNIFNPGKVFNLTCQHGMEHKVEPSKVISLK